MTRTANATVVNRRRYDVIVVGAGMAGSLVAKQLGRQGWQRSRVADLLLGPAPAAAV